MTTIITDSFSWDEVDRLYDRLEQIADRNINTLAGAQARGEAYLRKAGIHAVSGYIRVPVNCGQQLYDVIEVTDRLAGLNSASRRVLSITLLYDTEHGKYEQTLFLGGV
jgi:hypothetical protein